MTREEAIETLEEMIKLGDLYEIDIEACEMAIEALKQESTIEAYKQVCKERDIAIEQLHELGYEWGQKIEPCEDAISHDCDNCEKVTKAYFDGQQYAEECVFMPIIEDIRAEIASMRIKSTNQEDFTRTMAELYSLKQVVLHIIDKHISGKENT